MREKFKSTYAKWGITCFLTAAAIISFFFMIFRAEGLGHALGVIVNILTPFVYGLVMAFLTAPLFNLIVGKMRELNWPKIRGRDRSLTFSRFIASFVVIVVILGVVCGVLWLIIPQLVSTIVDISKTLPDTLAALLAWVQEKFSEIPTIRGPLEQWIGTLETTFLSWVQDTLVPQYDSVISGISEGIIGIVNTVFDFIVGLIICIFFINRKDIFSAQCKKLILAVFNEEKADDILRGAAFTNKTFLRFINGKLLDSLIIGIICYVVMLIAGWPYAVLISVIIGVTNVIPFFGPFIGAIPTGLLMLTVDVKLCVYFIIFIIILQQFDGNILGPKILGGSTGIASFWVIFAILVGGGLFGFVGMIVAIPTFAVVYAYICHAVNKKLESKGLSTDLRTYKNLYIYKDKDHRELMEEIRSDGKSKEKAEGSESKDEEREDEL